MDYSTMYGNTAWAEGIMAYAGIITVVGLAVYVFTSWALMSIANRTKTANAWLAWIPIGNLYLMTQIAKVPWWTMLAFFLGFIPVIGSLVLLGVVIWWWWKICEYCQKPGWWSLVIAFVPILNFVFLGIMAWEKK